MRKATTWVNPYKTFTYSPDTGWFPTPGGIYDTTPPPNTMTTTTTAPRPTIAANQGHPVTDTDLLTGPVIVTRYMGPTNSLGSRVKATHQRDSACTWRAVLHWDHSLDSTTNHQLAAEKLMGQWVRSDELVIVGRGHDHSAYYWLVVGAWQLKAQP